MKIILSCTTLHSRLDLFYYCVQSLLKQTLKPNLFLVNVSKESFLKKGELEEIPSWLNKQGIIINWVEETRSYRKLIPALEYADDEDLIITVDDDVLYSETLVEDLVKQSKENPDKIICARARLMKKNIFGNWQNYANWSKAQKKQEGKNIIPVGVGGVLYKKSLLDINFLIDKKYLKIAKTTDDLWFKMASLREKNTVLVCPKIFQKHKLIQHSSGLEKHNLKSYKSANFIKKLINYIKYKIINYFGINQTPNDFNWDNIEQYSNNV